VGVLMLSSLLSAGYLLPIVARGFFLSPPGATADGSPIEEAPTACLVALSCTAILCIVLFFIAGRIQTLLTGL
jgi:multicomponent Na+:H+ antiporter subunit D